MFAFCFLGFFIWMTILAHLLPIWNQIFAIYRRFQRIGSLREMFPIRWQPNISYPQDRSDHTFSVYVNRPGLSFGYFFRGGGSLSGVERGIAEFTVDGYNERAFISMNQPKAARLEIDDAIRFKSSILTAISRLRSSYPQCWRYPFYDGNGNPEIIKRTLFDKHRFSNNKNLRLRR